MGSGYLLLTLQFFCPKRGFETISAFDDRGRAEPVPGLSALKILVKVRQDRPREC